MSLLQELSRFRGEGYVSFHMPGHCYGKAMGQEVFSLDVTELPGTDNLAHPTGPILHLQQKIASLYGAEESFLLVNGSTGGILAAVFSAFREGTKVLVDRMCHKSVLHALVLSGASPVYLKPNWTRGIPQPVSYGAVEEAYREHPDAAGIVLTSPNYYGLCANVKPIADLVHQQGGVVIVDEAHGAHFPFHPSFPVPAIRQHADLVVNSLHKTLPSPTQTSVLHVCGERVDRSYLRACVGLFQTSSPSYVLMSYAEQAIELMEQKGEALWEKQLEYCQRFRQDCQTVLTDDPVRLVIPVVQGQEVLATLYRDQKIAMEAADAHYLIGIVSVDNAREDYQWLSRAISVQPDRKTFPETDAFLFSDERVYTPREAFLKSRRSVPLSEAVGQVCGLPIVLFPPGIMLIAPGERFTKEIVDMVQRLTDETRAIIV